VKRLRANSQKDVWLFGGGEVFRRLLDAGLVDSVELAIEPILLGGGIPLVRDALHRQQLQLVGHRVSTVGVVHLEYAVRHSAV
jgi:dihydrofolate reductase